MVESVIKNETGFQELGQNRLISWDVILEPGMGNVIKTSFDVSLKRHRNAYVDASCAHLKRRKPKDRVSAVVSAIG
jgi:hypothetical protein